MKRTHKLRARLLSAGLSLALLTTLLPGALAASYPEVYYEIDSDEEQYLYLEDFEDACLDEKGDEIEYIRFTDLPDEDDGILYDDYEDEEVSTKTEFDASDIEDLVFIPEEDCDGEIVIPFVGEASYEQGRSTKYYDIEGDLVIDVTAVKSSSSSSDDLEYEIDFDEVLELDYRDFDAYFDESVEAIEFTRLPDPDDGILYFDYDTKNEEEVEEDEPYDYKLIDDITFVPDKDFEGTVTIKFDAALVDISRAQSGTLTITVGDNRSHTSAKKGDVTVDTEVNESVYLDSRDFDDYCYDETDDDLFEIRFLDLPSSKEGDLYIALRNDDDPVEEDEPYGVDEIDDIFFDPYKNFEGYVTIPFEGEADSGETFKGDLVINVGLSGAGDVVVELTAATGSPLTFSADAFNEACLEEMGSNLSYVIFDYTSGRGGYLYYNYGENTEDEVGSARYYRSSSPRLSDVTFVPGSAAGTTTTIPFEGYTTGGKSFDGEVEITYVTLRSPSVVSYTSNGLAVDFQASDFSAACAARGGAALVSVTFPNPSVTGGQLYYSFTSPTQYRGEVVSSVTYEVSGIYQLSGVTFLPKAEYTGTVVIPYVGTDADGITYNGNIQITVTPPTSTTRFNDMGSYSWAVPGVEFLAAYGITTGTNDGTTYSPAGTMTRGDYILMLVRTFGLTSSSTANFNDVKADAYYASALATAKALGIITADANGNFRPTEGVTRQDSMVFLYRAMQAANRTVPTAYDSYLTRFPDGASVAADARQAVAAMAQAGVIIGDQAGRLNPTSTLTRGEMAVILHRALTL